MKESVKNLVPQVFVKKIKAKGEQTKFRLWFPIELTIYNRDTDGKSVFYITLGQARSLKEELTHLIRLTEIYFSSAGIDEQKWEERAKVKKGQILKKEVNQRGKNHN